MRAEASFIFGWVREPWFWLLPVLALVTCAVAYSRPFRYTLDIGGDGDGAKFDRPYLLGGFNDDPERTTNDDPRAFRWAFGDARLVFPGVGASSHAVTLRVVSGQPSASVPSAWHDGGTPLVAAPLATNARHYHVFVPATGDDLDLRITTPTFAAPNDPRALAFAADAVEITALGASLPPLSVVGWLTLVIGVGYMLLRRWDMATRWTFGIGVIAILCLDWLLLFQRLGLTTFLPRLVALLVVAYVCTLLLIPLLTSFARLLGVVASPAETRAIAALVVLSFVVRLGGVLHPQAYVNDIGLHANNLRGAIRGTIIFTEALPGEAGGGPAPYPPAQYVMLLPFGALMDARLLLQAATSLADSFMIVWGWLLLRAAGGTGGAALWAGALYIFALPILRSLLVGEMANVWGQALVGPMAVAVWWATTDHRPPTTGDDRTVGSWQLAVGSRQSAVGRPETSPTSVIPSRNEESLSSTSVIPRPQPRNLFQTWGDSSRRLGMTKNNLRQLSVVLVCLVVALLGHFGVFLSLLVFFAAYATVFLALRGPWMRFGVLAAASLGVAFVLYYSAHLDIILASPGRATVPFGFGRIWGELGKALALRGLLGPLVPVLGVLGLVLVVRTLQRLRPTMLAWMLGTVLSLAPLLWTQQPLRWTIFAFPALAWCGGVALHWLAAHGRVGRALAYATVAVLALWGALLWYSQIATYNH